MDENDVIGMYRDAKNKDRQIDILAELMDMSKYEVMAALVAGGQELPARTRGVTLRRLQFLEVRIRDMEEEYKAIVRALTGEKEDKEWQRAKKLWTA